MGARKCAPQTCIDRCYEMHKHGRTPLALNPSVPYDQEKSFTYSVEMKKSVLKIRKLQEQRNRVLGAH